MFFLFFRAYMFLFSQFCFVELIYYICFPYTLFFFFFTFLSVLHFVFAFISFDYFFLIPAFITGVGLFLSPLICMLCFPPIEHLPNGLAHVTSSCFVAHVLL